MRRRLTIALVALVAGALVVAGAGALVVSKRTDQSQATHQLLQQGEVFASAAQRVRTPLVLATVGKMLRLEDAEVIVITSSGAVLTPIRSGLNPIELRPTALLAGNTVSGWQGSLAFAAVPIKLNAAVAPPSGDVTAVLLTRRVGSLVPSWIFLLLVGGITLVVAAIVATQLSRRITRPLVEASVTTSRIAGGELSARVPVSGSSFEELDSLAHSINAMAAGLEAARHRESQMLLSVSHDLRTPLTSIRGYAEAIDEGVTDDPKAAARVIIAESQRLERLVGDLLDLAKLEAKHLSLHLGPVDPLEVSRKALDSFGPVTASKSIVMALDPGPSTAMVWADEDRLAQVVANLVQNAVEYARGAVSIGVQRVGGEWVRLAVSDDGAGIPAEDLGWVFDRFYQVDRGAAARRRGGSGLGLSIVAELVRAMGGSVHAESPITATGGTRMVVMLRYMPGQAHAAPEGPQS
ncbi:MAG: sensor histidine kinase [Acidimicrobiales bacterium]|jgi:signal transduction histidine kinase